VPGTNTPAGQIGSGVNLSYISRKINEALEARLRSATSDKESASITQDSLSRIEDIYNALGDNNLGTLLNGFFKSWGNLQNDPQNIATRGIVVNSAQALTQRIQEVRGDLLDTRTELNAQIATATDQADKIATKIADLNTQITIAESASDGPASALRDQRDQLLTQLSQLFSIAVREQPSGAVNVYIGNEAIVQAGQSFGLKTTDELDANGLSIKVVRLKEDNGQVKSDGGQVAGLIDSRDHYIGDQLSRLNTLAGAIINEVNKIHSSGKGLEGYTNTTGASAVLDPTATLSSAAAGLSFPPKTGSFFIDVKDNASGAVTRHQINIDLDGLGTDSSLNSVVADINANVPGVTATVLANGKLQLSAAAGTTFSFSDDTSGFLAATGINTFFTGTDAGNIGVSDTIASTPMLLAAGRSDLPGDGANATALVNLQNQVVASLGGVSLTDFYTTTTANIAVNSSSAKSALDASSIIFDSLTSQRESISGVNMDEETIAMITLQRGYEGAARYTTVVDQMLQTLLGLLK
jgi:flagellar hook-associated protein 1 FlgK